MNPNQSLMEAVLAADEAGLSYGHYMAAYGAGRPNSAMCKPAGKACTPKQNVKRKAKKSQEVTPS